MQKDVYAELFLKSLKGGLADFIDLESVMNTSFYLDKVPIQDSFCYRARQIPVILSSLLINEKAELDQKLLKALVPLFQKNHIIGPQKESDALIFNHIHRCLALLDTDPSILKEIKKFSIPLCSKNAEAIIRETLFPFEIKSVQTEHVRRAVVAAWLTLFRQSTGSCFATAPLSYIRNVSPILFFKDLNELLSTGQIKRMVSGNEYSAPLQFNLHSAALKRSTEFSKRSFGVHFALTSAGLKLSETVKLPEKISPENIFKRVIQKHFEITDEDLEDEKKEQAYSMSWMFIKQGIFFNQSPKAQNLQKYKQVLSLVCKTFSSLTECALLRAWEYSVATFSDLKTEFARWNLFISLGVNPEEKDGIGSFLYQMINQELSQMYSKIDALQKEYRIEMEKVETLDKLYQATVSESAKHQIRAELIPLQNRITFFEETIAKLNREAESFIDFFPSLIKQYHELFQEFFQEIFDPVLHVDEGAIFEDSPAGFRLVYKHRRKDASQWTVIYDEDTFSEVLKDFFQNTEKDLRFEGHISTSFISNLITSLIFYIQTPAFLESAKLRCKLHKRRSPWDYVSGGNLQTLLMTYTNRAHPFTEKSAALKSAKELLEFIQSFHKEKSLLMHSPNHAFIFYPEWVEEPMGHHFQMSELKSDAAEHLIHRISEKIPEKARALFIHQFRQSSFSSNLKDFRKIAIELVQEKTEEIVDSTLFENTPLLTRDEAEVALAMILKALSFEDVKIHLEKTFYGPKDLFELVQENVIRIKENAILDKDFDQMIADQMKALKILPKVSFFADTNWSHWFFGIYENPITEGLELWRFNRTATMGFPMSSWKKWLSEENEALWTVLINPNEYSNSI